MTPLQKFTQYLAEMGVTHAPLTAYRRLTTTTSALASQRELTAVLQPLEGMEEGTSLTHHFGVIVEAHSAAGVSTAMAVREHQIGRGVSWTVWHDQGRRTYRDIVTASYEMTNHLIALTRSGRLDIGSPIDLRVFTFTIETPQSIAEREAAAAAEGAIAPRTPMVRDC